ncbi:MAG: hypothetical protein AB1633_11360, partial [Elusimicrobiota bacterium]
TVYPHGESKNKQPVNIPVVILRPPQADEESHSEITYTGVFTRITGFGDIGKVIVTGKDLAGNTGISDGTYTKNVISSAGGVVKDPNVKDVIVEIPEGAVDGQKIISIKSENKDDQIRENRKKENAERQKIKRVGKEYKFGPDGTQFAKPVIITISYTDEEIKDINEQGLKIAYWNETTSEWEVVTNSKANPDENKITAEVTHFSVYQIVYVYVFVDANYKTGYNSSIAIDKNDYAHIAYYDVDNNNLKYAKWTGISWSIETVNSTGADEISLSLDTSGYAHIAYRKYGEATLKYARQSGSNWDIETVGPAGSVGTSLSLDTSGYPYIVYISTYDDVKLAKRTGSSWEFQTIPEIPGNKIQCSLDLDSNNYPHICYLEWDSWNLVYWLKYAKWTGTSWSTQTITQANAGGESISDRVWIVVDSSNNPHIIFDFINCLGDGNYDSDLKYAKWTGSSWEVETVDSTGSTGITPSLALDKNNFPHIAYEEKAPTSRLKYAKWTGSIWEIQQMEQSVTGDASIAVDSNNSPHIAYLLSWDFPPKYHLRYMKITHVSSLTWTGEPGYETDGLNYETGTTTMTFIFRIKYLDIDNDAPAGSFPKVYIKKSGVEISGSPFAMNYVSGISSTGAIYTYSTLLPPGTDYTYYFIAHDHWSYQL